MPSVSPKQARFFAAVAHDPAFAHRVGVPQSVGIDFNKADAGTGILSHPHHAFGGGIGSTPHINVGHIGGAKPPSMGSAMESPWWTRAAAHEMDRPPSIGGHGHFAIGGSMPMSETSPWTERADARIMDQPFHSGLIDSAVPGRTDRLPLSIPSESHIVPADAVSAAGQGNTTAGARIWQAAIHSGPWGVPLPTATHGHGPPSAPHVNPSSLGIATGGQTHERTSILAAGGELGVPPEYVHEVGERGQSAGKGKKGETPLQTGHRLIDKAIANVRRYNIKWLKSAPPPKR